MKNPLSNISSRLFNLFSSIRDFFGGDRHRQSFVPSYHGGGRVGTRKCDSRKVTLSPMSKVKARRRRAEEIAKESRRINYGLTG
jgi:hypothetical protein